MGFIGTSPGHGHLAGPVPPPLVVPVDSVAALLGYAQADMRRMTLEQLAASPERLREHLEQVEAHGQARGVLELIGRDGEARAVGVETHLVAAADRPAVTVAVLREPTEIPAEYSARLAEQAQTHDARLPVISQTLDGTITEWNDAAERLYGYTAAEIIGRPISLIVPPEHQPELARRLEQVRRGEAVPPFETVRQRKDGSQIDVLVRLWPVRDATGAVVGASAMPRDITERKGRERREALGHAVAWLLAEAVDLDQVVPRLLETIGLRMGWHVGELWLVNPDDDRLHRRGQWVAPSYRDRNWTPLFAKPAYARNEDMVGRTWVQHRPQWVRDVVQEPGFMRLEAAAEADLHTLLAFPLCGAQQVVGVLTFLASGVRPPPEHLRAWTEALGRQIGAFIERSRMQQALTERERELHARVMVLEATKEATSEAILVAYHNGHERVLDWNHAFKALWGFSDQEMATRSDTLLLEKAAPKLVDPQAFLAGVQRYYDQPEARGRDELVMTDGRVLDRYTAPVRDAKGRIQGRGWYFHDITARKRLERTLRESEARFRSIVEQAGVGIGETAFDDRILFANQKLCEMLGYECDELLQRRVQDITHPEDTPHEHACSREMLAGQIDSFTVEKRFIRKDGSVLWASLTASAVRDTAVDDVYAIGIVSDITERKEGEARLERQRAEAERRPEQLQRLTAELVQTEQRERRRLAQVLHDHLQQLLVGIRFQADLLQGQTTDAQVVEGLERIASVAEESIQTSRSLTRELSPPLLYEAGLVPALRWLAGWTRQRQGLTVHLEAEEAIDVGEETMRVLLFESVRELLLNVVKHARTREAWVRIAATEREVRVEVEDRGAGFDPEAAAIEHPERFGLFSLQERLDWLGGSVEIDTAPGRGTCVRLSVPRQPAPGGEPAGPAPPEASKEPTDAHPAPSAPPTTERVRVMLVDDHRVLREGLKELLSGAPDVEVVGEAGDGREALEQARRLEPDVMLMDVAMPGMGGLEATQRIRAELPQVRVIGLSMYSEPELARAMRQAGADDYLHKDEAPENLLAAIRRHAKRG